MSASNSIFSYDDIREVLDRALSADKGVSVSFPNKGAATHFIQRVYKFRVLDRRESKRLYPTDNPRYGTSVYDKVTLPKAEEIDGKAFVKILKSEAGQLEITEL